MTTPATKSFTENEPVLVGHFVVWLLAVGGEFLVGHAHLFNDTTWSGLATTLAPILTTAVLGAIAWFTRSVVSPAWKAVHPAVTAVENYTGLTDQDLERIALSVGKKVYEDLEPHLPQGIVPPNAVPAEAAPATS